MNAAAAKPKPPSRDPTLQKPRTAASQRMREVWDSRLRLSERELILQIARMDGDAAAKHWAALSVEEHKRVLIVMRDLMQLGNEAAYALGYSRRNG